MTLKQACPSEYQEAQGAFKDSMIHGILQFTLRIAFRCVLHRCESQEIHCWKLFLWLLLQIIHKVHSRAKCEVIEYIGHHVPTKRGEKVPTKCAQGCDGDCELFRECTLPPEEGPATSPNHFSNDPSAGSPTETLLRLLLPLNDQVWSASQRQGAVAGSPKPIRRPH